MINLDQIAIVVLPICFHSANPSAREFSPLSKITKRNVDAFEAAADRDIIHWDSELAGFGVRVLSSGRRSFIVQYRTREGRSRRRVIGTYPLLTPDQARAIAREWLLEARKGGDPARDFDRRREAPTIKNISDQYLEQHANLHKKRSSRQEDERIMHRYILPRFGNQIATQIDPYDIEQLHRSMKETPYQANRVLALLSSVFNKSELALRQQKSDWLNPCRTVKRYKESKRRRYLSLEELGTLGAILREAERAEIVSLSAISVIRLLIFTGCRKAEILSLRWADVDFNGERLRIKESKTGDRDVYLNKAAIEVLTKLPREAGQEFVFPGRRPGTHLENVRKSWDKICDQAELTDLRLHDLRHSFASVAVGSGYSLPIIGGLLGHTQAATTERYAHLSADPLRQASHAIGTHLEKALEGTDGGQ